MFHIGKQFLVSDMNMIASRYHIAIAITDSTQQRARCDNCKEMLYAKTGSMALQAAAEKHDTSGAILLYACQQ